MLLLKVTFAGSGNYDLDILGGPHPAYHSVYITLPEGLSFGLLTTFLFLEGTGGWGGIFYFEQIILSALEVFE